MAELLFEHQVWNYLFILMIFAVFIYLIAIIVDLSKGAIQFSEKQHLDRPSPIRNMVFAAASMNEPAEKVKQEILSCVQDAKTVLRTMSEELARVDSTTAWAIREVGASSTILENSSSGRGVKHKFCLGNSLEGAKISATSLLTFASIEDDELSNNLIENPRDAESVIQLRSGVEVDVDNNEIRFPDGLVIKIRFPDGLVIKKGNFISMKMSDETKDAYSDCFSEVDNDVFGVSSSGDPWEKIRIFGGVQLVTDEEIQVICWRHPRGKPDIELGDFTHSLSKVTGLVIRAS